MRIRKSSPTFQPLSLLAAAFLLACTLVIAFPDFVNAESSNSFGLTAKKRASGRVRLHWQFRKSYQKHHPVLEIERSAAGGAFEPLAQIDRDRSDGSFTDKTPTAGALKYRVRMAWTAGRSSWMTSKSVVIPETGGTDRSSPPPTNSPPTSDCPAAQLPSGISECEAGTEAQVFASVNQERAAVGARALNNESHLHCSSRIHTVYMIQQQSMTHNLWDTHIAQGKYTGWYTIGQNIAYGYATAADVMYGWMHSDGHRANIQNSRYTDIGVSCLKDSNGRRWWTQDFGGR